MNGCLLFLCWRAHVQQIFIECLLYVCYEPLLYSLTSSVTLGKSFHLWVTFLICLIGIYITVFSLRDIEQRFSFFLFFFFLDYFFRVALELKWSRICLAMKETLVWSLVWEDPTCHGAAKPSHHSYWAGALEPLLHNKRSGCNEKPVRCNQRAAPAWHS